LRLRHELLLELVLPFTLWSLQSLRLQQWLWLRRW